MLKEGLQEKGTEYHMKNLNLQKGMKRTGSGKYVGNIKNILSL